MLQGGVGVIRTFTNCFAAAFITFIFLYFFYATESASGQVQETVYANIYPFSIKMNNHEKISALQPMLHFQGKNYYPIRDITNFLGGNITFENNHLLIALPRQTFEYNRLYSLDHLFVEQTPKPALSFAEEIEAKAAVIIDTTTGDTLFSKNSKEILYPASTTKIMTALLALEHGILEAEVEVSEDILDIPFDSSRAHIRPGHTLTLEQLLYGLMLPSGNDAAVAIAVHIAGSKEAFVEMMNKKAAEIGAYQTNFVNSHGYHDPEQYTTAEDLAKISAAAAKIKEFMTLVSTPRYRATFTNEDGETAIRNWRTTNLHLRQNSPLYDPTILGGKTGFTSASRHTLVSFAHKDNYEYITVILRGQPHERYIDTSRLVERAAKERIMYNEKHKQNINIRYLDTSLSVGNQTIALEDLLVVYNNQVYLTEETLDQVFQVINKGKIFKRVVSHLTVPLTLDIHPHNGKLFFPFRSSVSPILFLKEMKLLETQHPLFNTEQLP